MRGRKRGSKPNPFDVSRHLLEGEVVHGAFSTMDFTMNRAGCLATFTDRRLMLQYDARPGEPVSIAFSDIIGLAANFERGDFVLESRRPKAIIHGYDMTLPGTLLLGLTLDEDGHVSDEFEPAMQWLYRRVREQLETEGDAMFAKIKGAYFA